MTSLNRPAKNDKGTARIDNVPSKRNYTRTQLTASNFYRQYRYFFTDTFPGLIDDVTPKKKSK